MKLATTTADFGAYSTSQFEAMGHIRDAGFRYVDYNFGMDYRAKSGIYAENTKDYVKKIRAFTEEKGLTLIQAHAPMGTPLAPENEAFWEDTVKCIDFCGETGIPNLVVHSGYLPDISKEECFEKNRRFFCYLLKRAEAYGVNILVENFNRMTKKNVYWVDNAPELLELIQYVDHPLFHAVWDTGHGNLQEMPQDQALAILGSQVRALHVQDNMGVRDEHRAPLFGTMNLDSLMTGLKNIAYSGYFTFEATRFFLPPKEKRAFDGGNLLSLPPLSLRLEGEKMLYKIGETILKAYGVYEA